MINGTNIFWDLDGVLRDLCGEVFGKQAEHWDQIGPFGKGVVEAIDSDMDILLRAKPGEYLLLAKQCKPLHVVTIQPEMWRPYTSKWCDKYIPEASVKYVLEHRHKLEYLKSGKRILIEDSPKFEDYTHVILIDRPYNQEVQVPRRVRSTEELEIAIWRFLNG